MKYGPEDSSQRAPGPIMLRRARDVLANPTEWHLYPGTLIWVNLRTRERVTDHLVFAVALGRFDV